eukprot:1182466-Prorocentrum_minimum.AAC.3
MVGKLRTSAAQTPGREGSSAYQSDEKILQVSHLGGSSGMAPMDLMVPTITGQVIPPPRKTRYDR